MKGSQPELIAHLRLFLKILNSLKGLYIVGFGSKLHKRSIEMQNYVTISQFEIDFQAPETYFMKIFEKFRKQDLVLSVKLQFKLEFS